MMSESQSRSENREAPSPAAQADDLGAFTRRALIVVGLAFLAVSLLLLLWYTARVFLLGFAGVLFAVFLRSLSRALADHTPLGYLWSLGIVLATLALATGLAWWLAGSQLAEQFVRLAETLPESAAKFQERLRAYPLGQWLIGKMPEVRQQIPVQGTMSRITGFATSVLDFFVDMVIIFFVGIYVAAEPKFYHEGIARLFPQNRRQRIRQVLAALEFNLRWYIYGRLAAMTALGVLTAIGLQLLGVPLALTLGLLAGVLQIIPNLGPVLSAIPAILVAWAQEPRLAMYVVLLYIGIQALENYILTPLVQRETVRLSPAGGLLSMILLGLLGGVLGLLVAAPLSVAVLVLVQLLYVEDTLGDPSLRPPGTPES